MMDEKDEAILLVDDENNVRSSLLRLLEPDGYRLMAASNAQEGLEALCNQRVWLVISDQAMPGTNGIDFLELVSKSWPDTIRVMLTGYGDLDSAMEAINRGQIYRFVTKPWDPESLRLLVRQALAQYRMVKDNQRMRVLIEEQNELLKGRNLSLQEMVETRTTELTEKNAELEMLFTQLKRSFVNTIKVFTGFIELRNPILGGHARRVSNCSRFIARNLGLSDEQSKEIEAAALLHDLGKLGLADEVLRKDPSLLSTSDLAALEQHPAIGQAALQIAESLEPIGLIIRHHHERWDGRGYPDRLRGEDIPLGSRIIAVADSLDHFLRYTTKSATEFIESHTRVGNISAFDPSIICVLANIVNHVAETETGRETNVRISELRPGMVLARDVRTITGLLLIPKGEIIKANLIFKLIAFERQKLVSSTVFVYR